MNVKQLRSLFVDQLRGLYPKEEIESIFSLIAERLLNYSKIDLHARSEEDLDKAQTEKIGALLERLSKNEPVQYVLGETEFYNLPIKVDRHVLIPRPETEYLVDLILQEVEKDVPFEIIDLCTGSGCIAIALAKNLPGSKVTAVDISNNALLLAAENAALNLVDVLFIEDSVLEPTTKYKQYHCIVSNPPYVRESEKQKMHANVLDYEPALALFVQDSDPLLFYRGIALFAQKYLSNHGLLYVEINEKLGAETALLFEEEGFEKVEILKDLNGKDRFVRGEKRG